ncbi:MAG: Abi family protein [Lachnospiraceae bacterium]|nr:Abi family protein [Lachnospiraceae bacterium]
MTKPKGVNALMKYMRDNKGIKIYGSIQKRKLRYMGYFHGYKGYRYHTTSKKLLPYKDFNEVQAVYNYDMELKTMFYPRIMFLETALKSFALEEIIAEAGSKRFADIYSKLMLDYKTYTVGSHEYRQAISKRMSIRNKIYSDIQRDYGKRIIVNHYYDKDQPLPIWAIFELLSLGEFASFIECLDYKTRRRISNEIGINKSFDSDAKLLAMLVYTLKDLRNAVAHNNMIFDTRFKTGKINKRVINCVSREIGINNFTFNSIVDYVIMIAYIMKLIKAPKTDIMNFIKSFESSYSNLRKEVSNDIYSLIVYTDTRRKLECLKNFL